MNESPRCPKCGIALPADAPAGLCPKCLVQAGFESQPDSGDPGPTKLTPPASGFEPLTVAELAPLFPQLEILELLGKGGMGAVYKARQPGLDRLVALKILPPEISRDAAFAERFQREARALARLSHPHIVAVYDFGQTDSIQASGGRQPPGSVDHQLNQGADAPRSPSAGSLCYILMEFVDGANLRQAIQTKTLASAEALAIVPQICEALQFAHDEGIVHRDIKPENILIDKRGRVKIADFGLAKLLDRSSGGSPESPPPISLTATHQVMGTLRYMAPEQMQGSREVDHRADIYSLGVVFYELLTGELPMGRFAPPSKRVQVDVRLDEIVLRALEQEPEQRYQHASEVKTDVDAISRSPSVARSMSVKGVVMPAHPGPMSFADTGRATLPTVSPQIRRQLKGPAIALMLYGLFILFPAVFCFTNGFDIADENDGSPAAVGYCLIVLSFLLLGLSGLLMRGGWHMLAVESYRAAFLGSFLGQPVGMWGLFVLSRPDVKSAFPTVSKAKTETGPVPLPQLVQGPADCLLLAAGIAFVTACGVALWLGLAASRENNFPSSMNRGNLIGMSVGLAIYSVLVGIAGLMMRRLRARLLVQLVDVIVGLFFPAVCALNVIMEFRTIPAWPVVIPLWLGIPAALWGVVTLFRDDVRRAFDAAAEQRAEKLRTVKSGERQGVSPPSGSLDAKLGGLTPSRSPTTRPKLVPVLATFNLVGAILLMLVCAMEEPAEFAKPMPRLWQVWEQVDAVLGFSMAAGMFAASIGLFLWKPWARKLTLGVCIFGLASVVFDAPYLARFALPDLYADIQQTVIAEGGDPVVQDFVALFGVVVIFGGMLVVGLMWLIGQLVYFTRPRVVAAFESTGEKHGKFIEWLFSGTGAVVGVLSVFGPVALLLGVSAMFNGSSGDQTVVQVPAAPPPLGTITSGIGAEFTVPAGHVATFEIVTRRDNETVPVPPHCGYVMAPEDTPVAGTFRWSRKPEEDIAVGRSRRWSLEIRTGDGGRGYSEVILLPDELNSAVGARGLSLGLLEPNEEAIHWGSADANNLPANGLIGLRVTVVTHGQKTGGSGNAHIDWKSQAAQSTSRRKLLEK